MIQIKPLLDGQAVDLNNGKKFPTDSILWQGIHVCSALNEGENLRWVSDLPIGHSAHWAYRIDLMDKKMEGPPGVEWLSRPFLESLLNPNPKDITINRYVFRDSDHVIILNCLDMMYGHSLLKLLNTSRHLEDHPDRGLIVLIPEFLRWLVPDGVAEIWSIPLTLSNMKEFYPSLDRQIQTFSNDYTSIWLSEAFSHPSRFQIQDYTRLPPHNFDQPENLVTFIWREDRLWLPHYPAKKLRKLGLGFLGLNLQSRKVIRLFEKIRYQYPETSFAVAGLGDSTVFPAWIEDHRTNRFNESSERSTARLYADSRVVIGVHGSNMLLPSALGGMMVDLVPDDKWGNHPQDTILQTKDARVGAFLYRYISSLSSINTIADIISSMLRNYRRIPGYLNEDNH